MSLEVTFRPKFWVNYWNVSFGHLWWPASFCSLKSFSKPDEIVEKIDWDKNRYITYNEFIRMVSRFAFKLKALTSRKKKLSNKNRFRSRYIRAMSPIIIQTSALSWGKTSNSNFLEPLKSLILPLDALPQKCCQIHSPKKGATNRAKPILRRI